MLATHSSYTTGNWWGGGGSACSLPADFLSKSTRNVPFTNVWVQKIVDIAVEKWSSMPCDRRDRRDQIKIKP